MAGSVEQGAFGAHLVLARAKCASAPTSQSSMTRGLMGTQSVARTRAERTGQPQYQAKKGGGEGRWSMTVQAPADAASLGWVIGKMTAARKKNARERFSEFANFGGSYFFGSAEGASPS